jgi:hypothetical protein
MGKMGAPYFQTNPNCSNFTVAALDLAKQPDENKPFIRCPLNNVGVLLRAS